MSFNFLKKILSRKPKAPKWSLVIDPGHGGRHSGAVNKTYGYMEKSINLHVAKFMEQYIIDQVPELVSYPTRYDDSTVSLPDRCQFANKLTNSRGKLVDAFVSIHTNARVLKGKYGLEIETFYFRGSEEGRDLAIAIQEKLLTCKVIYSDAGGGFEIPVIDRGVKVGQKKRNGELKDFYVLRETHMPAALVELGFLSDDEEAKLLIKPENQEMMAKAVVDGVVSYLRNKEE